MGEISWGRIIRTFKVAPMLFRGCGRQKWLAKLGSSGRLRRQTANPEPGWTYRPQHQVIFRTYLTKAHFVRALI